MNRALRHTSAREQTKGNLSSLFDSQHTNNGSKQTKKAIGERMSLSPKQVTTESPSYTPCHRGCHSPATLQP